MRGRSLRIILCTKRDLAGCLILNEMLPRLAGHQVMVLLSDKTRPVENAVPELAEMKFLERELPVDTLFPLVDQLAGDDAPRATFNGCAARYGVPVKVVTAINDAAGEKLVRDFAPDVMVSARFSLIFKRPVMDIPRLGTWNIHPGALPRYAGLFAPFRALVEGEPRMGCTLHRVDDGIDTGPVVGIGWLPVEPRRSLLWHVLATYKPGIDLFFQMLERMQAGLPVEEMVQDDSQRDYVSLPGEPAFETFRAKGFRLYDPKDYLDILTSFLPSSGAGMAAALGGLVGAEA